ncbi:MAG: histidine kinase, partial [Clostridia bacterium]|nr:histidine kinase [Clostridia bacterium]
MTAKDVALQIESLVSGVPYTTANLANISALLYIQLKDVNWCGFYLAQGEKLVLGPFQGKPACIEIPFGKGVCGTAAAERKAVAVPDV